MTSTSGIRALVLLSGGLDSQLAAALLKAQGIEVTGVVFRSIFFDAQVAIDAARSLGIPLRVIEFNETILGLIEHPTHGFGAGLNPCIDCHTAMIKIAGKIMREEGFHFVATGEVLGERPMSQNRRTIPMIAQESGLEGYLLRPLSAKLLEITEPEKKGWVDRERLLAIEGRSRRPQMALARELGITSFPQPAGGCLLTDPGYGKKLRDMRKHGEMRNLSAIGLLQTGRHFRLGDCKLIVGRNQYENKTLEENAGKDAVILKPRSVPGPVGVLYGKPADDTLSLAGAICAAYCKSGPGLPVAFEVSSGAGKKSCEFLPAKKEDLDALRV